MITRATPCARVIQPWSMPMPMAVSANPEPKISAALLTVSFRDRPLSRIGHTNEAVALPAAHSRKASSLAKGCGTVETMAEGTVSWPLASTVVT